MTPVAPHSAVYANPNDTEIALRKHITEMDTAFRRKPTDRKRTLGIFYTPSELSSSLAAWAVTKVSDTILEPSFGGCGFLTETARALADKGHPHPWDQLCGCDKDLRAFYHLPDTYRKSSPNRRFLHANFLETKPSDYCIRQFSVVIGNPPYVSRHNMRKYQLRSAELIRKAQRTNLSRRASLWVYFILHSLNFLKVFGRMAWVLPRSLSQANYGRQLTDFLCSRFSHVTIVSLEERFFLTDGAEEVVDVLLCSDYRPGGITPCSPRLTFAKSIEDLDSKIRVSNDDAPVTDFSCSAREQMLSDSERLAVDSYARIGGVKKLSDWARIKIGIVTGMKKFFVLSKSSLASVGLSTESCVPLLTKSAYVKGLGWSTADITEATIADQSIFLVRDDLPQNQNYWSKLPVDLRDSVATFKKRLIWNKADDGETPAGFFMALVDNGPKVIINSAKTNCNNSIYRLAFAPDFTEIKIKALSILFLSSFVQISGELVGRIWGSGGLKFEPSDAGNIQIPNILHLMTESQVDLLWAKADALIRNGYDTKATEYVDDALIEILGAKLTKETTSLTQSALAKLRGARKRSV